MSLIAALTVMRHLEYTCLPVTQQFPLLCKEKYGADKKNVCFT